MAISVPLILCPTSLNYISHLQNSISQRANTPLEKFQPVPVKHRSAQREQLLFLIASLLLTSESCANIWGGLRESSRSAAPTATQIQAAETPVALFPSYRRPVLQRRDHKHSCVNEGLLCSEPSLQTTSSW